jgi:hypothetical protein
VLALSVVRGFDGRGFAGRYWNTVGSKEGWQPATFVSRRSAEGKAQQQFRPEDFMDEEDMGEGGIAPKTVKATDQFEQKERPRHEAASGSFPFFSSFFSFLFSLSSCNWLTWFLAKAFLLVRS